MRKLIVAEQISLDGVIQSPGAPEEDPSGKLRLGGWVVPYGDEAIGQDLQDLFSQPFELLLGRRTYGIFATLRPAKPGVYRLRTTGEVVTDPDFLTTWEFKEGDPNKATGVWHRAPE